MKKIIIDTDSCFDDVVAMVLALKYKNELEVLGINVVSGCTLLEKGIYNPYRIMKMFNTYVVGVYPGNNKALNNKTHPVPELCGDDGLGGYKVDIPTILIHQDTYLDFTYKQIKLFPNQIEIVCLGPLTNIAKLFSKYPDAISLIKELHIMGTTGQRDKAFGNDKAEYNIWADVEAAKIVFASNVNKKVLGFDISFNNPISKEKVLEWKESSNKFLNFIYEITILARKLTIQTIGKDEVNMVDQLLISYLIDSSIAEFKKANITILDTQERYGESIVDFDSPYINCELCVKYNLEKSIQLIEGVK